MRIRPFLFAAGFLSLFPLSVKAECIQGPVVVVNAGHGASITFDEPVYQAKIFDISRVILNEIPETGTKTLILTEVDPQLFPGLPSTPQTTLLAATSEACYTFQLAFGTGNFHVSVDAQPEPVSSRLLSVGDLEPLDLDNLRLGIEQATARVGPENTFLQRANQFLTLVTEEGVAQRLAAQRLQINWSHLTALAAQAQPASEFEDSVTQ